VLRSSPSLALVFFEKKYYGGIPTVNNLLINYKRRIECSLALVTVIIAKDPSRISG
jgi:hypothetical protein